MPFPGLYITLIITLAFGGWFAACPVARLRKRLLQVYPTLTRFQSRGQSCSPGRLPIASAAPSPSASSSSISDLSQRTLIHSTQGTHQRRTGSLTSYTSHIICLPDHPNTFEGAPAPSVPSFYPSRTIAGAAGDWGADVQLHAGTDRLVESHRSPEKRLRPLCLKRGSQSQSCLNFGADAA